MYYGNSPYKIWRWIYLKVTKILKIAFSYLISAIAIRRITMFYYQNFITFSKIISSKNGQIWVRMNIMYFLQNNLDLTFLYYSRKMCLLTIYALILEKSHLNVMYAFLSLLSGLTWNRIWQSIVERSPSNVTNALKLLDSRNDLYFDYLFIFGFALWFMVD